MYKEAVARTTPYELLNKLLIKSYCISFQPLRGAAVFRSTRSEGRVRYTEPVSGGQVARMIANKENLLTLIISAHDAWRQFNSSHVRAALAMAHLSRDAEGKCISL